MAAKAGSLGISVIASRTSPTDLAVRICGELGITLVGYVRGRRFNVYTHPARIAAAAEERIPGVTGVILAGGPSTRMGSDKALLPYQGGRFIEAIHRRMEELFDEVIVATGETGRYDFLPCRRVTDLYPGMGALAGIHAALRASGSEKIFVVACDMPHLAPDLIRHLCSLAEEADVVVPEGEGGLRAASRGVPEGRPPRRGRCAAGRAVPRGLLLRPGARSPRSPRGGGADRPRPVRLPEHQHPRGVLPLPRRGG